MVLTSVIVLLVAMTLFAGMRWWFQRLGRRRVGMLSPIRTSPFRDPTPCLEYRLDCGGEKPTATGEPVIVRARSPKVEPMRQGRTHE